MADDKIPYPYRRECLRCGVQESDSPGYSAKTYFGSRRYCLKCIFVLRDLESRFWEDLGAVKLGSSDKSGSILSIHRSRVEYGGDKPLICK